MSTLAINHYNETRRHYNRTILMSLLAVCFLIIFNQIYQLFGHGQTSLAMQTAFVYPLIISLFYLLLRNFKITLPFKTLLYKIGYNFMNSGIATLSIWAIIKGVFEIAGTNSSYLILLLILGGTFITLAIALLIVNYHLVSLKK